jgi:hypothetical protein
MTFYIIEKWEGQRNRGPIDYGPEIYMAAKAECQRLNREAKEQRTSFRYKPYKTSY